jgi:hypothetical protein
MLLINSTKPIIHKAIVFFCLFISFWGVVSAYQYGAASLDFYRVNNILTQWKSQGEPQSEAQYLLAKNGIMNALNKHPNHPLYVDVLGQVYEWGALSSYEKSKKALSLAKQNYLHATQLRPAWPVTWASLAMIKWRLQEFDDELLEFLANASKFGPFKPEVHILYSQLGLALYKNNHPLIISIRPEFERHLVLGLRNPASRQIVINTINNSGLKKQVCRWLKHQPESTISILNGCKRQKRQAEKLILQPVPKT